MMFTLKGEHQGLGDTPDFQRLKDAEEAKSFSRKAKKWTQRMIGKRRRRRKSSARS